MGPVGAAMGAFKRADNAMRNRARSILKRRPNLKHREVNPKPGRAFKARTCKSYVSNYATPKEQAVFLPSMLAVTMLIAGILVLVVGIPMALSPNTHASFSKNVGSDLACAVITGVPMVLAASTWLFCLASRKR